MKLCNHLEATGDAPLFSRASIFATSPSLSSEGGGGGSRRDDHLMLGLRVHKSHFEALRSCLLRDTASPSIYFCFQIESLELRDGGT